MIHHIIFRSYLDGVTDEQIAESQARSARFVEIDGIESVVSGSNLGIAPFDEGLTHATVIVARDREAIQAFLKHELHAQSNAYSSPLTRRRIILDIAS